jgi:serine phosphatase RsbU (regulator of sigma subunit)/ligand-binding sensor domain-containing protein
MYRSSRCIEFNIPPALLLLVILLLASSTSVSAQQLLKPGLTPTRFFSATEYEGQPQNWAVRQDHRGVMYFGNNSGVLEYDGENWRTISITNETNARSLCVDKDGRVFVGAQAEFGYLAPDSSGQLIYNSLLDKLTAEDRDGFTDVWQTHAAAEGIWFHTKEKLFFWAHDSIQTINPTAIDSVNTAIIHTTFLINDVLYVKEVRRPLKKVVDGKLVAVGNEVLASSRIYSMLPYGNDEILIATRSEGLFILDANEQIRALPSSLTEFFGQARIYSGIRIDDNLFLINTLRAGSIFIDREGNVTGRLDESSGLPEQNIKASFIDAQGKLWLATQNGIIRLDHSSPTTHFGPLQGLPGTIQTIVEFNGRVFVATALGVFHSDSIGGKFEHTAMQEEAWHLSKFVTDEEEYLIIVSSGRVYTMDRDLNLKTIVTVGAWSTHQTKLNPDYLTIALETGLMVVPFENGIWGDATTIQGIDNELHNMCEDDHGNLWIGEMREGVVLRVKISETDTLVTKFGAESGIPIGFTVPCFWNNRVVIGTANGLFEYDPNSSSIVRSDFFKADAANTVGAFHRLSTDSAGRLWVVYETPEEDMRMGYQSANEPSMWKTRIFTKVSEGIVHAFLHDEDGISLLGGSEGLHRFDPKKLKNFDFRYPTLIRKVLSGRDSLLFYGAMYNTQGLVVAQQPKSLIPTFNYSNNSLKIFFSNCYFEYEGQLTYQYMLDGNDDMWSEWALDNKANYTNLHEGMYTFKVKAKNIYGEESEPATYTFTILPPWYRTWWAYIIYVLGFATFVYGAIVFSTRRLKEIIRRATQEIVAQKEKIEEQKKLVDEKNKDITDSIAYASTIQAAILPSTDKIREFMPDHFILFRPRDVVSGDFYWINKTPSGKIVIVAGDCTGHGVPGAFMSMIGNSLLNEIILENAIVDADVILNRLKEGIIKALRQKEEGAQSKDGMDLALTVLDPSNNTLEYAGANNSLYLIRPLANGQVARLGASPIQLEKDGVTDPLVTPTLATETHGLFEIKPDNQPIGYHTDKIQPFTKHLIQLEEGDSLYLFTDGYADQFGGPKGKKFKYKPFKSLLLSLYGNRMAQQERVLEDTLLDWMGDFEQIDDICIVAFKI